MPPASLRLSSSSVPLFAVAEPAGEKLLPSSGPASPLLVAKGPQPLKSLRFVKRDSECGAGALPDVAHTDLSALSEVAVM